jgi:hypothetical protein
MEFEAFLRLSESIYRTQHFLLIRGPGFDFKAFQKNPRVDLN